MNKRNPKIRDLAYGWTICGLMAGHEDVSRPSILTAGAQGTELSKVTELAVLSPQQLQVETAIVVLHYFAVVWAVPRTNIHRLAVSEYMMRF